ncbi:MAG: hypothetical protein JSV03_11745 [Planctomycetota bacterium]|nr:MAG: hypothetical protein JSV03_11745 [Planctomycetota bacterium]
MLLATGSIAEHFTWVDWAVVFGYLIFTTLLGGALAGKQATIRDFFLGGRKLPWYAVSGSIIATEISAVTFVGVPAIVFGAGGNFTYLQLGLFGSILARIIIGYIFVPAYYRREIYSPYDYMANELGNRVRTVTTCLFTLGSMLAQGARVYLTALITDLIIGQPLFGTLAEYTGTDTMTWSIFLIGFVAVVWTLMGGITTVIWTDVILFLVFFFGAFTALGFVIARLPGDMWESIRYMFAVGYEAKDGGIWGKFTFFDWDISPTKQFTMWTAAIASTWAGLGSYGTDQLMTQRMFCCKGSRQARIAIISSSAGQIITTTMLFVGVGLYAFYCTWPLTGETAELVNRKIDRIFPIFIIQELPWGITGLLIAAIFAAAISSLDSILAALSQTTMTAFYLPWRNRYRSRHHDNAVNPDLEDKKVVFISRIFVVFWALVLCFMAHVADAASGKFPEILNLALSMAGYTVGALLAGFMLAFFRLNIDDRGFVWSAPLSVFVVFAIVWHDPWAHIVCWAGSSASSRSPSS